MPERDLLSDDTIGILAAAAEAVETADSDESLQEAQATFAALVATHLPYRRDWRFLIDPDETPGEATNEQARRRDATLKVHYAARMGDKDRVMAALGKEVMDLDQWTSDHTASSNDAEIIAFPVNDNWGDGTGPEMASSVAEERRRSQPLVNRPTPVVIEADESEPVDEPVLPTETRNDEMSTPETPATDPTTVVVTATMVRDKDTKNTVRYAEAGSDTPAIGTIYLPKRSIEALGNPESITVTVSVA